MPYDPDSKLHEAITQANDVIKLAEEAEAETEAEPEKEATLGDILDAVKELTSTVATLAKESKEMKERHDKWIKAGKF
jgi:Mg2+ and Co2+ transporter CorA